MNTIDPILHLTPDEQSRLQTLIRSRQAPKERRTRARILLKAAEGKTFVEIAAAVDGASANMASAVCQRFLDRGIARALTRSRPTKYTVSLAEHERDYLQDLLQLKHQNRRIATRARVLLMGAEGANNAEIAMAVNIADYAVSEIRRRFTQGRLALALYSKPRSPSPPKYPVKLTDTERRYLETLIRHYQCSLSLRQRARILLSAGHETPQEIAAGVGVKREFVTSVCRRFVKGGLRSVLTDKPRGRRKSPLTGKQRAKILTMAQRQAPGNGAGSQKKTTRMTEETEC